MRRRVEDLDGAAAPVQRRFGSGALFIRFPFDRWHFSIVLFFKGVSR
jgi:hypothetical protein